MTGRRMWSGCEKTKLLKCSQGSDSYHLTFSYKWPPPILTRVVHGLLRGLHGLHYRLHSCVHHRHGHIVSRVVPVVHTRVVHTRMVHVTVVHAAVVHMVVVHVVVVHV